MTERPAACDIAIIGAGSAGFSAAITAAGQGARVALIGRGTLGGTCVNVGCVPSKTLIRAVGNLHQARAAARFAGIRGQAELTDWRALVAQKDALVAGLRQRKYADLLAAYEGIDYFEGPGRLADGGVTVNGSHIRTERVVVTTGARPALPAIPGIDGVHCLTSTSALALDRLPESLLVLGGGYIGVELAQLFARAGVAVTLVCRSRLLPAAEPEISQALKGCFEDEGIRSLTGVSYGALRRTGQGSELRITRGGHEERLHAEQVLVATGRRPNTEHLGLDEAGVECDGRGAIAVDAYLRTSRAGVYAAGDVTGRDPFVYMAAYGARLAAGNALNGDTRRYDSTGMPAVVFTDPQVASAGLTERQARDRGLRVRRAVLPLEHVPRALAARDTRGLIKLVAAADTDRLLGAHILAPEGGDSIQTAALAIRQGLTVRELADMIYPYLTTVEGLKLAAQSFDQDVARLSCCAG
ncbi:MAG: mercury(II) reductase [Candidatus Competibacterales bacterium]|nr:mercury(II) reductase [Candidatus Competibacterales bacterium]